jgi:hypothetical protein
MFGAVLMLIDNLWGVVAVLPFDWHQTAEITVGVSFLIGLPMYFIDWTSRNRLIIFLPALLVFRWLALSFLATPQTFVGPWRVCELIIMASIVLQWSKLKRFA